ncbi:tyrosine--tRNA ligase [candidate division WOR-3 bacterium]|nr:tyrosine--tRNA ligase [candidate division WOR-3 bacterium]
MDKLKEILKLIKKGTYEIIPEEELINKLRENRPLRVKLGIDATGPDIHLGSAVVLRKLRQFQELGHKAILIVGNFTAKIGDPSGRSKTRPQLTNEQIKKNMENYRPQIFKILLEKHVEFKHNSEWLSKLTPENIIKIASNYTVAQMLKRDDFSKRYSNNIPIAIHELLYALFQAYDSVATEADIELGGTDQKWNLLLGRELQREFRQPPQVTITMPLLEGIDGVKKMSSSYNNYVGITESSKQMFGKLMSIPDTSIINYFKLTTNLPVQEIKSIEKDLKDSRANPMDIKLRLAREVVSMYHSSQEALKTQEEFLQVFSKRKFPKEIPEYKPRARKIWIIKLLVDSGLVSTRSEARRLIGQGGVKINEVRVKDVNLELKLTKDLILKVGKRKFLKIKT